MDSVLNILPYAFAAKFPFFCLHFFANITGSPPRRLDFKQRISRAREIRRQQSVTGMTKES